jgi:UDP-2-acetamido-2,6-beta-L-arabino-hexul-4-ose reductase
MDRTLLIKRLDAFTDARGQVFEPLAGELAEVAGWPNFHVATVKPGAVRGNHLHPEGTEVIVLFGSEALLSYVEDGTSRQALVEADSAVVVTIPPGIPHAFRNTGEGDLVLLCFQSRAYDPDDPDRVAVPLLSAASPE